MPPDVHTALFREFAQEFPEAVKVSCPHPRHQCQAITVLRLDVERVTELWLTLQLRHDQWDGIVKCVNPA
jgi:hypothetical protein